MSNQGNNPDVSLARVDGSGGKRLLTVRIPYARRLEMGLVGTFNHRLKLKMICPPNSDTMVFVRDDDGASPFGSGMLIYQFDLAEYGVDLPEFEYRKAEMISIGEGNLVLRVPEIIERTDLRMCHSDFKPPFTWDETQSGIR